MTGITDLATLLQQMQPALRPGEYVYCLAADSDPAASLALSPLGFFREDEGLTLILDRATADAAGLAYGPVLRCITLTVHSALEAVGLTAAVSAALTRHGISANVVAAYHHDHIFVPVGDAERALLALKEAVPV
ncbi:MULTISPECIES: ACT domain-containing protein [unclassified Rhizobium]|uniref:ACT domain-containing protein n=1 Tax=unclassified Rhizobium TaxID=2613769 RepID=UPI000715B56E|nr:MULTISPECIES: ACT domain-containing protein [unclassified Rhizobium]KQS97811.1 transporter [Rhizobium sp. Leaf386]KQT00069.1 transporter [Rhizobium sp. Leaf391]KQT97074.1 transporter [Rhizobium sp. Leaf453]